MEQFENLTPSNDKEKVFVKSSKNDLKLHKPHHSVKKAQTSAVMRRNQRERTRVKGVNDGFGKLRLCVPTLKSKPSKVETLKGAIDYIQHLRQLLGDETECILRTSEESFKEDRDGKFGNIF